MRTLVLITWIFATITACEEEAPPAPPATPGNTAAPTAAAPAVAAAPEKKPDATDDALLLTKNEGDSYNPIGKRDPFMPATKMDANVNDMEAATSLFPLQKFGVNDLRITGIVWGVPNPRAIIQAPDGKGYVVHKGSLIGQNWGKVTLISEEKVLIEEEVRDSSGKPIIQEKELSLKPYVAKANDK